MFNVAKNNHKAPFGNGFYMFLPPICIIYDDLGEGLWHCFTHINHSINHPIIPI